MSFVHSQQEGPILILTLDRPQALNALNAQVLDDLDRALDAVDLDTVRCLILTGSGEKAFAAGADIAAMAHMNQEEAADFSRRGNQVFRRIETFPLPTIAAVNGYALGGGCELSMACDIRLCSENAIFGQPEVTLGITPGFGGTQRLMRLIGMGRAKELIFSSRTVKAAEALGMGLVNAVYPASELLPAAKALAARIGQLRDQGKNVSFLIGGSLGLSKEAVDRADEELSLSKLTLPHRLARLVLLEQLYRSFKILNHETYHK